LAFCLACGDWLGVEIMALGDGRFEVTYFFIRYRIFRANCSDIFRTAATLLVADHLLLLFPLIILSRRSMSSSRTFVSLVSAHFDD
jgi:hypothetical protein